MLNLLLVSDPRCAPRTRPQTAIYDVTSTSTRNAYGLEGLTIRGHNEELEVVERGRGIVAKTSSLWIVLGGGKVSEVR
jgi:hypothetical protein